MYNNYFKVIYVVFFYQYTITFKNGPSLSLYDKIKEYI